MDSPSLLRKKPQAYVVNDLSFHLTSTPKNSHDEEQHLCKMLFLLSIHHLEASLTARVELNSLIWKK